MITKQVIETKFLGILIDHHLSWKPHISLVSKKILKSVNGIIAKAEYLANMAPLCCQRRLLDIFSINSFSITIFMYSYHHNLLPVTFQCFFTTVEQFHQYNTRTAFQYRSHFCRTNIKEFSTLKSCILYQSPIVSSPSISVFKKNLKNCLIESQFLS